MDEDDIYTKTDPECDTYDLDTSDSFDSENSYYSDFYQSEDYIINEPYFEEEDFEKVSNMCEDDLLDSHSEELFESPEISTDLAQQIFERCNFDMEHWNSLTDSEKIETLNQLEGNLAELQGRNPVEIQVKNMDSFWDTLKGRTRYGYYDPNTGEIYINSSLLNSPEKLPGAIDTVIHEGIHAYQHQCINGEVEHYNPQQVVDWAENFRNYKSAALYGMEVYLNQPVEVFARINAGKITDLLTLAA